MKCPKCGCENLDNATYCNLCQTSFKPQAPPAARRPIPTTAYPPGTPYVNPAPAAKGLNWFQRHLNLTWVLPQILILVITLIAGIGLVISIISSMGSSDESPFSSPQAFFALVGVGFILLAIVSLISTYGIGAWVLHRKHRSYAWLLVLFLPGFICGLIGKQLPIFSTIGGLVGLACIIIFLCLKNHSDQPSVPQQAQYNPPPVIPRAVSPMAYQASTTPQSGMPKSAPPVAYHPSITPQPVKRPGDNWLKRVFYE
jgi:uncharacterized membrane protein YhaH (DUF805 family)